MCELRRLQEEPGVCRSGEVHPGYDPEAGGGLQHREEAPGEHDGRRPGELQPGGHRRKKRSYSVFMKVELIWKDHFMMRTLSP